MTVSIQTDRRRVDVPAYGIPGVPVDALVIAESDDGFSITHPLTGRAMAMSPHKEDLEEAASAFWQILSKDERDGFRTETEPQRIRPREQAVEYFRLKLEELRRWREWREANDEQ